MTVKLFQDVAGTIPAVLAGQPVGFIKRTKGSDDAKQATALSKPTLGRWPKSGVRNLAMGAQAVSDANYWPASQITSGITVARVGSGIEGGVPYVDINYLGVVGAANGQIPTAYLNVRSSTPAKAGERFSARLTARLIGGVVPAEPVNGGIRLQVEGRGASLSYTEGAASPGYKLPEDGVLSRDHLMAVAETTSARVVVFLQAAVGATIDCTFRIKGLQFEKSDTLGALQFNYGPNDITEAGVPDVWHLYNDGVDSLNVTLQAGTYGLATIGIDQQIVIGTFVSDGTTPVNILRHERQLDVSYRLGAYSAAEEIAIRDAWGRKYA